MTLASPLNIGLLLFPDVEELDVVGPYEVFTAAEAVVRGQLAPPEQVRLLAESDAPVRCAKGMVVNPHATLAEAGDLDVLLVPGGMGTRREVENAALMDWIKAQAPKCRLVTSVCTGALLLAEAGLLEGKAATTYWAFADELQRRYPGIRVRGDERYIDEDPIVTSAGVSAGIDMALYVTGKLYGEEVGRKTQKYIQYDPAPPHKVTFEPENLFPPRAVN